MEQAKTEFQAQFELAQGWMRDLGLPYEAGVRIVRDFYEENKAFYQDLVKRMGKPMLVEMWNDRFFYFVTKFEFNVNDALDKAAALSTVQIDVENTERFDIQYTDRDGKRKHPLLLHASISGSIDRCLYTLLEREAINARQGVKPMLPFWLSPVQIRILTVSQEHLDAARGAKREIMEASGRLLRIEIDDREEGIGRKIRDAEKAWVPIIVVLGDKEAQAGAFKPRFRRPAVLVDAGYPAEREEFDAKELGVLCRQHMTEKPEAPLPLSEHVGLQPTFRG
jgi:threonyl-tRNA synthetase